MTLEALFQATTIAAAAVMAAAAWRMRTARPSSTLERAGIGLTALAVVFAALVHGEEVVLAAGLFAIVGTWAFLVIAVCAAIESAIAWSIASIRGMRGRSVGVGRGRARARQRRPSTSTAARA